MLLKEFFISTMDGKLLINIRIGQQVAIVQKHHQSSGELTEGTVNRILTKSANHPHGIKVMLTTGEVGRVKQIRD
jgi:uncharacterized repeat protein (TIGR03833 family)